MSNPASAYARYVQHDAAKTPQESPYYLPDGFIKFNGDAFERDCEVLARAYHEARGSGWIDVRERLPERDVDVLVVASSGDGTRFTIGIAQCMWGERDNDGMHSTWQDSSDNMPWVRFWQPLPPPPTDIEA